MNLFTKQKWNYKCRKQTNRGKERINWKIGIDTYILPYTKQITLSRVKQITSPGGMHETSAGAWCTGKIQRDRVEREVGGEIGMGNTCISMADSCQCMKKTTTVF